MKAETKALIIQHCGWSRWIWERQMTREEEGGPIQ